MTQQLVAYTTARKAGAGHWEYETFESQPETTLPYILSFGVTRERHDRSFSLVYSRLDFTRMLNTKSELRKYPRMKPSPGSGRGMAGFVGRISVEITSRYNASHPNPLLSPPRSSVTIDSRTNGGVSSPNSMKKLGSPRT